MENFRKLGINELVLKSIKEQGFTKPTEIQEKAIPLALQGKDIIGGSATGSGKTLAFGASIIQNTEMGMGLQSLILTPTRELAEQVSQAIALFSKYKPIKIIPVYGGVGIEPQIFNLRSAEVVVGTPGRILDHMQRRTINFSKIKVLVLDEADRMLDMGFIDDVKRILSQCPKPRQTFLFSATISSDIAGLAKDYMKNPTEIAVEHYVDPSLLEQVYYDVPGNLKISLLVSLLKKEDANLVMVFCNTKSNADFVERTLKLQGLNAVVLHGGLTQNKRTRVVENFHKTEKQILVCTDVAARGLDIKNVSHVYNYDIPNTENEYVHRIGRTARAGKQGKAVNILSNRDYDTFRRIKKLTGFNIIAKDVPMIEKIEVDMRRDSRGYGRDRGRGGFRQRTSNSGFRPRSGGSRFGSRGSSSSGYGRSSRPRSRDGDSHRERPRY